MRLAFSSLEPGRTLFQSTPGFGVFLICLVLGTAQIVLNVQLRHIDGVVVERAEADAHPYDPDLYRALSFGHLPASLDWLWIRILSDASLARLPKGKHTERFYDLDLVTDLDPFFFEAYVIGANLLSVIHDDGDGAKKILVKGDRFRKSELGSYPVALQEKYWSNSWNLSMLLGYVNLFEVNDLPNAATAFKESAEQPGAPAYLHRLANQLEQKGGEYTVGLRVLDLMIRVAKEARVKEVLKRKYQSLLVSKYLFDVNADFLEFLNHRPKYRVAESMSIQQVKAYWNRFIVEKHLSKLDPWGGELGLDENGRVISTTPRIRVFNLE